MGRTNFSRETGLVAPAKHTDFADVLIEVSECLSEMENDSTLTDVKHDEPNTATASSIRALLLVDDRMRVSSGGVSDFFCRR